MIESDVAPPQTDHAASETRPLFTLTEPSTGETPLVVEVPHAGIDVPPAYLASLVAPARSIGRDADLYVDDLYADAPFEGATLLVAHTSRYVLDLNRGEGDLDADTVLGGPTNGARMPRGLIWRLTTDGDPALARPLTAADVEARLHAVHRPYHAALLAALERKKAKFGYAVLLAAHSMPSVGRSGPEGSARRGLLGGAGAARADVVPGTHGRTTAAACFIDAVDAHARAQGFSVRHDDPYKGGFTTRHYGVPAARVHAVQIELARRLYMDETTLLRSRAFDVVRRWCRALVVKLGQTALR